MRGRFGRLLVFLALAAVLAGCSDDDAGMEVAATGFGSSGLTAEVDGVVAIGSASVTVTADEVYVVSFIGNPDEFFDGSLSERDRDDALAALRDAGFAEDLIEFHTSTDGYSPPAVSVEVEPGALPDAATKVDDALTDAIDDAGSSGLWFGVEDCTAAFGDARTRALDDARAQAEELAAVAGVDLGDLTSVSETTGAANFEYLTTPDPCAPFDPGGFELYDVQLAPLTSTAEVELDYAVSASFDIGDADRTVSATGTASVEGEADEAFVIVVQEFFDTAPEPLEEAERRTLEGRLGQLDVPADAIEVDAFAPASGGSSVRVKVPVGRLDEIGEEVVDAIQETTGEGTSGVLFRSSDCAGLVDQARAEAYADAGKRLDALAGAANVQTGGIVGLLEGGAPALYGGDAAVDPCDDDIDVVNQVVNGFIGPGSPTLEALGAEPIARVSVELTVTRAITG